MLINTFFISTVFKNEILQNFDEIVGEIERWVEILRPL